MFAALKAGLVTNKKPTDAEEQPVYERKETNSPGMKKRPQVKVFNIPDGSEVVRF